MTGPPPSLAGQTHPRDEDEYPPQSAQPQNGQPVFKRPRIEKLPYGQLYNESDWINLHPEPITLAVQLPVMPDKPEWKMDGSVISIEDLPVATLFSTLRQRIKRAVDADLPISRIKLDYNGKTMNNKATMASVNLDDGEMIVMSIRAK
jgi:splicing factor 3A subunit 1